MQTAMMTARVRFSVMIERDFKGLQTAIYLKNENFDHVICDWKTVAHRHSIYNEYHMIYNTKIELIT